MMQAVIAAASRLVVVAEYIGVSEKRNAVAQSASVLSKIIKS